MNNSTVPKNISALERRVYETTRLRAQFVGISINELCARTGVAPSTFSRWVHGHHSGLIATIGRMDDILTHLEAEKFHSLQIRIEKIGSNLAEICLKTEISVLDYMRWVKRELDPDYDQLRVLEAYLSSEEAKIKKTARRRKA